YGDDSMLLVATDREDPKAITEDVRQFRGWAPPLEIDSQSCTFVITFPRVKTAGGTVSPDAE
ncbi:unnamed protein product, partial [Symbiodinium pilosum]